MHWESDKLRAKSADLIEEVTKEYRKTKDPGLAAHKTRLNERKNAHPTTYYKPIQTHLGKYLMHVSRVFDAMDVEHEVCLLRENLHANPPLHARRTLDQSQFSRMMNTKEETEIRLASILSISGG